MLLELGEGVDRDRGPAPGRDLGIAPDAAIAVGDGANDLAMLKEAGLGVGFRPKDIVRREAPVSIEHGDLTALLYLQGYKREDFVD